MMPRINSSMMTWAGYDDSTGELDITFIGGKTYRYFEVPSEIYDGLLDAQIARRVLQRKYQRRVQVLGSSRQTAPMSEAAFGVPYGASNSHARAGSV